MRRLKTALLCATLAAGPALAEDFPDWQDDFQSRLEVHALMQTLSVDILGGSSATKSLEKWCRDHELAETPKIVAERVFGEDKAVQLGQLKRLGVDNPEQVKYRKVRLVCGEKVLSEADNWYVPGRLTGEMNRLLDTTDTPFGKAVADLQPSRQTLSVKMLFSPLPEGWEMARKPAPRHAKSHPLDIPEALFEHQTLLYSQDGKPIAEVHEVYQRQILAFPVAAGRLR